MNGRDIIQSITDFIFLEDAPQKADILCIPGGSWPAPSERAAALYRDGYAPLILPAGKYSVKSGRFGGVKGKTDLYNGNYVTEWEFMADVLRKNGVPESAILREDQSEFTKQNADFSRRVTDALKITVSRGILCCKAYHARRCLMYYAAAFPHADWIVCPSVTKAVARESWQLSEDSVKTVLGELGKCGGQFGYGELQSYLGAERKSGG